MHVRTHAVVATALLFAFAPQSISAQSADDGDARPHATAVYVATNTASGNAIVAYRAAQNGALSEFATYSTGGSGVGPNHIPSLTPSPIDPLGSSGSITSVRGRRTLLAVNAGSASISAFSIAADDTLVARGVVPSGGIFPTSIAALGTLVYVANVGNPAAGTPATVSGFILGSDGRLAPISNSTRTLSQPSTSRAASIVFSPDGRFLVAADSSADRITTFAVNADGRLGGAVSSPSAGGGPFAAVFHGGALFVQETQSGVPGATSLTSYRLLVDGHVVPIASSVGSGETAGCWLATRAESGFAYVADTGSGTISSYVLRTDGTLRLAVSAAAPVAAASAPIDLALSEDGAYLFELYSGLGEVVAYRTAANGALSAVGIAGGLPASGTQGIVVY